MTVSTATARNTYTGTGITGPYTYSFRIFADSELLVTTRNLVGGETTLVLTTDYTVTGAGNANGGTITLTSALTTGWTLSITRNVTLTQATDLQNQGAFYAQTIEDIADKRTMIEQQLDDTLDRALRLPVTETGTAANTTLPVSTLRANKALIFDASGNPAVGTVSGSTIPDVSLIQVVDTVAALKALAAPSSALTYLVRGYYAAGDGGGGFWRWASASAATANNGTIIQLDAGGAGRFLRVYDENVVSVRWFGAKGDDSNADASAIQAAIDTGKTVEIPDGTYRVGTALTVATEGQIIQGRGRSARSVLKATAAIIVITTQTTRHITIRDLHINGNATATYGVKMNFPKHTLENCRVTACVTAGVWMAYFSQVVKGCDISDNTGRGILIEDGAGQVNDMTVCDSIVSGNTLDGIAVNTTSRDGFYFRKINMENNAATSGNAHIFLTDSSRGAIIRDCYFENDVDVAGSFFIKINDACDGLLIDGCKFSDGAATTHFDYFIRLGESGTGVLESGRISNCWASGYAQKFIRNFLVAANTSHCTVSDVNTGTNAGIADSGQCLTILPKRVLYAERITSNQTFDTADDVAVFNQAQGSSTQGTVDGRIAPASYSISTGIFTCFESGVYLVSGAILVTDPGDGVWFQVEIKRGGTSIITITSPINTGTTENPSLPFAVAVDCDYNDTIKVEVEASAGTADMRVGSHLMIAKLGGLEGQMA